jgi:hypothetical protein
VYWKERAAIPEWKLVAETCRVKTHLKLTPYTPLRRSVGKKEVNMDGTPMLIVDKAAALVAGKEPVAMIRGLAKYLLRS